MCDGDGVCILFAENEVIDTFQQIYEEWWCVLLTIIVWVTSVIWFNDVVGCNLSRDDHGSAVSIIAYDGVDSLQM